jgi:hypothetical protein
VEGQHQPPHVHKGKGRDPCEGLSTLTKDQEAAEIDQQTAEDARIVDCLERLLDKEIPAVNITGPIFPLAPDAPTTSYTHKMLNKTMVIRDVLNGSNAPDTSDSLTNTASLGSELSEPNSEESERTRKRKRKLRHAWKDRLPRIQLEQSNAKLDPPFVYNGELNFQEFDKWVLEVKDWLKHCYIRRKYRVTRLKKYVGRKASAFYMRDVAPTPEGWSLSQFLQGLFNHCFPPNFRSLQRQKFESFSQKGHPIQDY